MQTYLSQHFISVRKLLRSLFEEVNNFRSGQPVENWECHAEYSIDNTEY